MKFSILIYATIFMLWGSIIHAQSNQELITRLICSNLSPYSKILIEDDRQNTWNDLLMFLEQCRCADSVNHSIKIKRLNISVSYTSVSKFPFIKSSMNREIRINFWADRGTGWNYHTIVYNDRLSKKELKKVENPNLFWTKGSMSTDEEIEPDWFPAFLLISGSVIVIFTFFYVRS